MRGFGEASPSHASKAVRTFPGAEDLLDAATDPVDRAVPFGTPPICLGLAPGPDMSGDDPWGSAACANHASEDLIKRRSLLGALKQCFLTDPTARHGGVLFYFFNRIRKIMPKQTSSAHRSHKSPSEK